MTELRIIMAFILSAMGLFLIWAIISVFFAFFFCTFLYTIGTGFFRWFQRNPLFLNPRKTDRDMSHFVRLPTAFQVYSSLGIKLRNPKFNAQKGINRFQTLLHSHQNPSHCGYTVSTWVPEFGTVPTWPAARKPRVYPYPCGTLENLAGRMRWTCELILILSEWHGFAYPCGFWSRVRVQVTSLSPFGNSLMSQILPVHNTCKW